MGDDIHILVGEFLDGLIDWPRRHWLWLRSSVAIGAALLIPAWIGVGILRRWVVAWRWSAIRILLLRARVIRTGVWLRRAIRSLLAPISRIGVLPLLAARLGALCWIPTHVISPLMKQRQSSVWPYIQGTGIPGRYLNTSAN